jgi:hypothetical protein
VTPETMERFAILGAFLVGMLLVSALGYAALKFAKQL